MNKYPFLKYQLISNSPYKKWYKNKLFFAFAAAAIFITLIVIISTVNSGKSVKINTNTTAPSPKPQFELKECLNIHVDNSFDASSIQKISYIIKNPEYKDIYIYQSNGIYTSVLNNLERSQIKRIKSFGNMTSISDFNCKDMTSLIEVPKTLPLMFENFTLKDMFSGCTSFNSDLSGWDVSNCIDMSSIFTGCNIFNQDLSKWKVGSCTNMSNMFSFTSFNSDLSGWNVSSCTNMSNMFAGCTNFNQNLSSWNVSNCIDMSGMFSTCNNFDQDLSEWNVSNCTDMSSMFYNCTSFNQDLNKWKLIPGIIKDVSGMFNECSSLTYIFNSWDIWYDIRELNTRCMFGNAKINKNAFTPIKTGDNPKQTFLNAFC